MIFPYHVNTQFSINKGFCKIDSLVRRAAELNLPGVSITDIHSLSGCVEFIKEIKKVNSKRQDKIKGVIGCEVRINEQGRTILLLAQNKQGYKNLLKIVSNSVYGKHEPFSHISTIQRYNSDLICILSGYNSLIAQEIWKEDNSGMIESLVESFKGRIYIGREVHINSGAETAINSFGASLAEKYGLPAITGNNVLYTNKEDSLYLKIIIADQNKLTLQEFIEEAKINPSLDIYVGDENYLKNSAPDNTSLQILNLIEEYDIEAKPDIPQYRENNKVVSDSDKLLYDLCRQGWLNRKINQKTKNNEALKIRYADRVKHELKVLQEAKLSSYMLVVRDFIQYCRTNRVSSDLRGSAVGCLTSHLIGITDVDPVMPDPSLPHSEDRELSFERFYNWGRNSDKHISMPDCDIDVGISFREALISYAKNKYGEASVGNIITFGRMDGRAAVKMAFRVLKPVPHSFELSNKITNLMKDTAKVQDTLEDLKEEDSSYNIIQFNIDYEPQIASYYEEYKEIFDIAIKLLGTITHTGKHAAGIIISNELLENNAPILKDESTGSSIVCFEMEDAEAVGLVKFDFLGVAAYEKIDRIIEMINLGSNQPKVGIIEENINE